MTYAQSSSAIRVSTPVGWLIDDDPSGDGALDFYYKGTEVFALGPGGNIANYKQGGSIGVPALRVRSFGTGATTTQTLTHNPSLLSSHGAYFYANVTAITGTLVGALSWTDETNTVVGPLSVAFVHMETGTTVTSIVATGHYVAVIPNFLNAVSGAPGTVTLTLTPTNATFNWEMYITVNF
jgi:hypothetical protein